MAKEAHLAPSGPSERGGGRVRERHYDRQHRKCLKAQETTKNFPSSDPTSVTSLTGLPTHTLKHLYDHACLLMALSVNNLPVKMQEQSN